MGTRQQRGLLSCFLRCGKGFAPGRRAPPPACLDAHPRANSALPPPHAEPKSKLVITYNLTSQTCVHIMGAMPGPAKKYTGYLHIRIDPEALRAFQELVEERSGGDLSASDYVRAYIDQELEAARRKGRKRAS